MAADAAREEELDAEYRRIQHQIFRNELTNYFGPRLEGFTPDREPEEMNR
jgi:hypothetical protein